MIDYEEPVRPDRPPPTKQPEEYHEEEMRSLRNGIGGFLIGGLTVCRTVQVFSRTPGSAGTIFVAAWAAGVLVQGFYFHGHMQLHGRVDLIPFELVIAVQAGWWLLGLLVTFARLYQGSQASDSDLGRGVLTPYFLQLGPNAVGIVSDVTVGLILAGFFRLFASPVQSNWYLVMVGWLLICHLALLVHRWYLGRRILAAKNRAAGWREDVHRSQTP